MHRHNQDTITTYYLYALGSYRLFYIFNWIYRYQSEHHIEYIAFVSGTVQTLVYGVFFIVFMRRPVSNVCFSLIKYGMEDEEIYGQIPVTEEPEEMPVDSITAVNSPVAKVSYEHTETATPTAKVGEKPIFGVE